MNRSSERSDFLVGLFNRGRKIEYKKGEIILRTGDMPEYIYLITEGFVKMYSISNEGSELVQIIFGANDIFPVSWVFTETMPVRNVFYQALTPVNVSCVARQDLFEFIKKNNDAALDLLRLTTETLVMYSSRIDNLLHSSAPERIAYRLIALIYKFGIVRGPEIIINLPLTHQEIANQTSITRETASRILSKMQRNGSIFYTGKDRIVVKDLNKLIDILGEDTVASMWPTVYKLLDEKYLLEASKFGEIPH